ncbi:MAG TPA: hypothetical protein PLD02_17115 [Saprospiraceae bacterium]|nr:hypothetical protein [Saprospiraceae bacterium]
MSRDLLPKRCERRLKTIKINISQYHQQTKNSCSKKRIRSFMEVLTKSPTTAPATDSFPINGTDHLEIYGGQLLAHKAFWQYPEAVRKHCTITELIYVPNEVRDGFYLLDLQTAAFDLDASPSRPVLFLTD